MPWTSEDDVVWDRSLSKRVFNETSAEVILKLSTEKRQNAPSIISHELMCLNSAIVVIKFNIALIPVYIFGVSFLSSAATQFIVTRRSRSMSDDQLA